MPKTYAINEEERKQFAGLYLLERMINMPLTFPLWLERNDKDLEPVLEWLLTKEWIQIEDTRYAPTEKGRETIVHFKRRYQDFLKNFDVFCAVDLESGEFAFEKWFDIEDDDDWHAFLDQERWEDLRVAVADFKGLNPVEVVFMSFLNEDRFGQDEEGWQFDLLLGTIWDEILEICNTALQEEDLAYEDPEDGPISGESVLKDVIQQGAELNLEIRQEESEMEEEDEDDDGWRGRPEDRVVDPVDDEDIPYDVYRGYRDDPYYVNPEWRRRW